MANHKSALKRHRQSVKRRNSNRVAKSTVRGAVRKVRSAVEQGEPKETQMQSMKEAEILLAKAARKGIIPKGTASRNISRLAKKVTGKKA